MPVFLEVFFWCQTLINYPSLLKWVYSAWMTAGFCWWLFEQMYWNLILCPNPQLWLWSYSEWHRRPSLFMLVGQCVFRRFALWTKLGNNCNPTLNHNVDYKGRVALSKVCLRMASEETLTVKLARYLLIFNASNFQTIQKVHMYILRSSVTHLPNLRSFVLREGQTERNSFCLYGMDCIQFFVVVDFNVIFSHVGSWVIQIEFEHFAKMLNLGTHFLLLPHCRFLIPEHWSFFKYLYDMTVSFHSHGSYVVSATRNCQVSTYVVFLLQRCYY